MDVQRQGNLRRLALGLDAVLVLLSMLLASGIHTGLRQVLPWLRGPPSFEHYAVLTYLVLPIFLAATAMLGLHQTFERVWTRRQLLWDLTKLHGVVFLAIAVLMLLTGAIINRSLLLGFLLSSFGLLYLERSLLFRWRRFQQDTGQGRTRILLVGAVTAELAEFVAAATVHPMPPHFVGRVGVGGPEAPSPPELPARLGDLGDLARLLHEEAVDEVLFFPPLHLPGAATPALQRCEALGIPARFAVGLPRPFAASARLVALHGAPFISFETQAKRPEALAFKHGVDVVLAFCLLWVLSPVLLLTIAAIALFMGRPIFFVQERAGLFGRRFRMLKFRTMVADAEQLRPAVERLNEMSGPVFKASADPRVTRLGHLLRQTSIDELPQLFHVLLGTMSLVGPRPLPREEQQRIQGWHRRRLSMKPGITGLWQVEGRNDLSFEEWMRLDLAYVDRWSLWLDAQILLKTIPAVLLRRGAR